MNLKKGKYCRRYLKTNNIFKGKMQLKKYDGNPILKANEKNFWENLCVLNPAVIYDDDTKEFKMLYRAAGDDAQHRIYLGLAVSKDGYHFDRCFDDPVLKPIDGDSDGGSIEDPRLVKMGEWYYLTYASRPYAPGRYWTKEPRPWFNPPKDTVSFLRNNATLTHLAISKDLVNFKKLGRITDSRYEDRDVIIFPEKINGKFYKLSRPMSRLGEKYPHVRPAVWISKSDDLMEWEQPELMFWGTEDWEDLKVGASCPPIRTEKGWFLIYHGVSKSDKAYRVGAMLLDLNDPAKIIARTKTPIMVPEYEYEIKGYYTSCVFPTGNVVVDGKLYVYYGAADKYICVATCDFDELINYLYDECR